MVQKVCKVFVDLKKIKVGDDHKGKELNRVGVEKDNQKNRIDMANYHGPQRSMRVVEVHGERVRYLFERECLRYGLTNTAPS
jgi:hypothetical protein